MKLTVDIDIGSVHAEFVHSFALVVSEVPGLDVEDGELEPDLRDGQHVPVGQQLVDEVFVIVCDLPQPALLLHFVPACVRRRPT